MAKIRFNLILAAKCKFVKGNTVQFCVLDRRPIVLIRTDGKEKSAVIYSISAKADKCKLGEAYRWFK
jgi:hypothetical protein